MTEPDELDIAEALAGIEALSICEKPTPERAVAYWYCQYESERRRREMTEKALRDSQIRHGERCAQLLRHFSDEAASAKRWKCWALLFGAIAAVAVGMLMRGI